MKKSSEIRKEFIEFFKSKDHNFVKSSPVVPQDDPTLLFTNAGMNQFKSIFLGDNPKELKRATNSQKCMRVSGKHNDLEEVGVDHHHHTFFEMLGNWSFGDYYKKEAISWAWELITDVWKLPKDKLYATVYLDDDEALNLWESETDIPKENIMKFGKKENFWEMGETGPCGPCSEIHLDLGEGTCINEDDPNHKCAVNADGCGRFIEIWNLVFMQYNRQADGSLEELPQKHVDTGMGFERITRVIQGVDSNYSTDVFTPIISKLEEMSSKKYSTGKSGIPFRVIADHIRSLVFAITDGALPSNDGRGYVLRRILRRAYRFGNSLGFKDPFLFKLVDTVAATMGDAFPEITERTDFVKEIIKSEEDRFSTTLESGLEKLSILIEKVKNDKKATIDGKDVFTLYDTFGFPIDLTALIARENGLSIDEKGFSKEMEAQRDKARKATQAGSSDGLSADGWTEISDLSTKFKGYELEETTTKIAKYKIVSNKDGVHELLIMLEETPFYAEMGGQVGDTGTIQFSTGIIGEVTDTIKWNDMAIHKVVVKNNFSEDILKKEVIAKIDKNRRKQIRANHSATHLLQSALVKNLGDHVAQSGSRVSADGLRFDFNHFKALTKEEIESVEKLVNGWVQSNYEISTEVKNLDDAKKSGAKALFGEKYEEDVRVVSMGDVSKELCGGTHTERTGDIALFHIISESSISAGVRRIEAVTGNRALEILKEKESVVNSLATFLKVPENSIVESVKQLSEKLKSAEKIISDYEASANAGKVSDLLNNLVENEAGLTYGTLILEDTDKKSFSSLADAISDALKSEKFSSAVFFLTANVNGKALFFASAGKSAVKEFGIHCGSLVKSAAQKAGGGGGGNPVRAQAGGKDTSKLKEIDSDIKAILKETNRK